MRMKARDNTLGVVEKKLDAFSAYCSEFVKSKRHGESLDDLIAEGQWPPVSNPIFPNPDDLHQLQEQIGELPSSYAAFLASVGARRITLPGEPDWLPTVYRILTPKEVVQYQKVCQGDMDFNDGLAREILQKHGVDFHRMAPVIAGASQDGRWGMLMMQGTNPGSVILWDTDQAAYLDHRFDDVDAFLCWLLDRAMTDDCYTLS